MSYEEQLQEADPWGCHTTVADHLEAAAADEQATLEA